MRRNRNGLEFLLASRRNRRRPQEPVVPSVSPREEAEWRAALEVWAASACIWSALGITVFFSFLIAATLWVGWAMTRY